jgi:hypothetical protein
MHSCGRLGPERNGAENWHSAWITTGIESVFYNAGRGRKLTILIQANGFTGAGREQLVRTWGVTASLIVVRHAQIY